MTESLSAYIAPIKKRWVYHFIVSPKTSLIDKPEWYLNQTLKWIHEHIDEVDSKVKLNKAQQERFEGFTVKQVFILSMIELAIMRLNKDLKSISNSIVENTSLPLLVHTYNEVIAFAKVVRQLLGDRYYMLQDSDDILFVITNKSLFEKIVDVEWEYGERILKEIIDSDNAWSPVLEGDFHDAYKIPKCVDRFVLLIRSISDRVECFRQLDCQFKLIELQCFLFNKFLIFLKKSADSTPSRMNILSDMLFFAEQASVDRTRLERVVNGVNYLRLLLIDRFFIPEKIMESLDIDLVEKSDKLIHDYKSFYSRLLEEPKQNTHKGGGHEVGRFNKDL